MKSVILPSLLLLLATSLHAQRPDSLRTTYTQEECRLSSEEINRFICYVTRANVEERTLVKVGFRPTSGTSFSAVGPTFSIGTTLEGAIERKLSPSVSVMLGFDANINYAVFQNSTMISSQTFSSSDKTFRNTLTAKAETRYYYAKARQIRAGKSANNFSGNYFSLQLARPIAYYYYNEVFNPTTQTTITRRGSQSIKLPSLTFLYGIQRRLGRFAYVDLNVGPQVMRPRDTKSTRLVDFSFQFNANIGLGL